MDSFLFHSHIYFSTFLYLCFSSVCQLNHRKTTSLILLRLGGRVFDGPTKRADSRITSVNIVNAVHVSLQQVAAKFNSEVLCCKAAPPVSVFQQDMSDSDEEEEEEKSDSSDSEDDETSGSTDSDDDDDEVKTNFLFL